MWWIHRYLLKWKYIFPAWNDFVLLLVMLTSESLLSLLNTFILPSKILLTKIHNTPYKYLVIGIKYLNVKFVLLENYAVISNNSPHLCQSLQDLVFNEGLHKNVFKSKVSYIIIVCLLISTLRISRILLFLSLTIPSSSSAMSSILLLFLFLVISLQSSTMSILWSLSSSFSSVSVSLSFYSPSSTNWLFPSSQVPQI